MPRAATMTCSRPLPRKRSRWSSSTPTRSTICASDGRRGRMSPVRLILASLLAAVSVAAAEPTAADLAADAKSIEQLVNGNYAYVERLPAARMPLTDKLRAEAAAVSSRRELVRYAERALLTL